MSVQLSGPFWKADFEIVSHKKQETVQTGLRGLFLGKAITKANESELTAGTVLMLGYAKSVQIDLSPKHKYVWRREDHSIPKSPTLDNYEETEQAIHNGTLSLILAARDPDVLDQGWRCINGELPLHSSLDAESGLDMVLSGLYDQMGLRPVDEKGRNGAAKLLAKVTVHSSGLSILGETKIPWQLNESISGPFLLTHRIHGPGFELSLELDRLTESEKATLRKQWSTFREMMNPKSAKDINATPHWVNLEIAETLESPQIYWKFDSSLTRLPISFKSGDSSVFSLLLTDRAPQLGPQTLARVGLKEITIKFDTNSTTLYVEGRAGTRREASDECMGYRAHRVENAWSEEFHLSSDNALDCTIDPIETSRFLRQAQDLPTPTWLPGETLDTPFLWAFMPMSDGWAQLPIPNLTEQIYLDAELDNDLAVTPTEQESAHGRSTMQGAVLFGNEGLAGVGSQPCEHPWSVALTKFKAIEASWKLTSNGLVGSFQLSEVTLEITKPELTLNGFLWLSTEKPTIHDALPTLENWVSGLRNVTIRTVNAERDIYPSLIQLRFVTLNLSRRSSRVEPNSAVTNESSAELNEWLFHIEVNRELLKKSEERNLITTKSFDESAPWVWRRHPSLPMIQALPMTQNAIPPNSPCASRQLVPFQLTASAFGIPHKKGAMSWSQLLNAELHPSASAWRLAGDLPLTSLTIPGVVLQPEGGIAGDNYGLPLEFQYRYDVPSTDEINALAQLPEISKKNATRQANSTSDVTVNSSHAQQPLTRITLEAYWNELSEKASLAAGDAVSSLRQENGKVILENLIEPFVSQVAPSLNLEYPGSVRVFSGKEMSAESAQEGITGHFSSVNHGLMPTGNSTGDYAITAGSMHARSIGDAMQDQRGLLRKAGRSDSHFVRTPVELKSDPKEITNENQYELTTTTTAIPLAVPGDTWKFWMRDVPVRGSKQFDRSDIVSEFAEDVNDPESLSRERNYLLGYEWRLQSEKSQSCLKLCKLDFYPLTLENVKFDGDGQISSLQITGRLQLPLRKRIENEQISNAVVVDFERGVGGLVFENVELAGCRVSKGAEDAARIVGEWALNVDSDSKTPVPRLRWNKITFEKSEGILKIDGYLHFFLFDFEWVVPLAPPLSILASDGTVKWERDLVETEEHDPSALMPSKITVCLRPDSGEHSADLELKARWGDRRIGGLITDVVYSLVDQTGPNLVNPKLFGIGLKLDHKATRPAAGGSEAAQQVIHFSWFGFQKGDRSSLLPSMRLDWNDNCSPGFAMVSFHAIPKVTGLNGTIPRLTIQCGFIESLLACSWSGEQGTSNDFQSSGGDLVFGYVSEWKVNGRKDFARTTNDWQAEFLVNGRLEITNLISWPQFESANEKKAPTIVELPALDSKLNHIRHSVHLLLNQHRIPSQVLGQSVGESIFTFVGPWQLLAVVEHRFVETSGNGDAVPTNDRRFSAVQEVRFFPPKMFADTLEESGSALERPIKVDGGSVSDNGYLCKEVLTELANALRDLDSSSDEWIVVEASSPHWVRTSPLAPVSFTDIQYLPNGVQRAALSQPRSFSATDPTEPEWQLITLPFLGRLQDVTKDAIGNVGNPNPLRVDPIHLLSHGASDENLLARMLANRSPRETAVEVSVLPLDTVLGRTFARLDSISLEENWYRLQNPPRELVASGVSSVMSAAPDTPAALSRAKALQRANQSYRPLWNDSDSAGKNLFENPEFEGGRFGSDSPAIGTIPDGWVIFRFSTEYAPTAPRLSGANTGNQVRQDLPILIAEANTAVRSSKRFLRVSSDSQHVSIELGQTIPLEKGDYELSFNVYPESAFEAKDAEDMKRQISSQVSLFCGTEYSKVHDAGSIRFDRWGRLKARFQIGSAADMRVGIRLNGDASIGCRGWRIENPRLVRSSILTTSQDNGRPVIEAETLETNEDIVWRSDSLLVFDVRSESDVAAPIGWHLVANQIDRLSSQSIEPSKAATPIYYPSASLLPMRQHLDPGSNFAPISFAVSPYSAIDFQVSEKRDTQTEGSKAQPTLKLLFAELLHLDDSTNRLCSVGSNFWENIDNNLDVLYSRCGQWGAGLLSRICPDSKVAVLRYRKLNRNESPGNTSAVSITYSFDTDLRVNSPTSLAKRVFSMRTKIVDLRFREGQFGGYTVPESLRKFEVSPPLTIGVQPLYFTVPTDQTTQWPWGWSGIRIAVQYTLNQDSVIGNRVNHSEVDTELDQRSASCLWWQTPNHIVQYRSSKTSNRSAGLPSVFRAKSIHAMLPVLPKPPLPTQREILASAQATESTGLSTSTKQKRWQSILPGSYRYIVTGNRPGVMFAIRNQLVSQNFLAETSNHFDSDVLVSGGIPVQHRMPRPVPVNRNSTANASKALQTWASRKEVERNVFASDSPADEVFFAESEGKVAQRVRMVLKSPSTQTQGRSAIQNGTIDSNWDGRIELKMDAGFIDQEIPKELRDNWLQKLESDVSHSLRIDEGNLDKSSTSLTGDILAFTVKPTKANETLPLSEYLSHMPAQSRISIKLEIAQFSQGNQDSNDGFTLPMVFWLTYVGDRKLRLPLVPTYLQFEDPEYNRRLATVPATASANVMVKAPAAETVANTTNDKSITRTITVASDRVEYNPNSTIAFRWDWDESNDSLLVQKASLELHRINHTGIEDPISSSLTETETILPARLYQLFGLSPALQPGDQLKLTIKLAANELILKPSQVVLILKIVEMPIIPAPEAGYALLRQLADETSTLGNATKPPAVDCGRFAWGPLPERVDLVCANDLRTGLVRRRAVFRWIDISRTGIVKGFCIQKITNSGSTHFPSCPDEFQTVEPSV